ncbi:hypothetical protein [Actinopolyspora erythraea]|uniref:hypothetical protein n=1 Tax=Actinopolyspora erythraea TaxID=414996 RepID=UPI001185C93A|nr:hypothetical protein [Actinopolyspora erythraea]
MTEDVQRFAQQRFAQQLSERVDVPSSMSSSGGHVSGTGQRGQITEITIDPRWASSARNSEIESELTDLLRRLKSADSPGELAQGPSSSNIDELNALVSDPQRFLRRLGLTPPARTDTNGTGTR